ncbi:MAG: nitroreductase [Edaphocola sp.]
MNQVFENIASVIKYRRTNKAANMNGRPIANDEIMQLLQLADYAPTHARTEPWRFFVYTGAGLEQFCTDHADMYWQATAEENRKQATYDSLKANSHTASHLVIAAMKRTPMAKIPKSEEYAATAAAVQNILLGAEALGIASIWSTGGMALKPQMKAYLHLEEDDEVLGFVYLGHADVPQREPLRNIPLEEKIIWHS